jgi:hypothetical protein
MRRVVMRVNGRYLAFSAFLPLPPRSQERYQVGLENHPMAQSGRAVTQAAAVTPAANGGGVDAGDSGGLGGG